MKFERDYSDYSHFDFQTVQQEGLQAFAVREDGGIILSTQDKKLISHDSSGKLLKEEDADSVYRFLCYSGENLYGYDYYQSVIVDLTEATPRIVENSLSFRTIYNMVAVDDKLYVLAIPDDPDNQGDGSPISRVEEFEDWGEVVYCIDAESGQYSAIDLEHIIAMYRTESGKLYFYGWQEDRYYLYEYDTQGNKVASKLHQDSMGDLSNLVVEGGYLFGVQSFGTTNGLVSIDLGTGEKEILDENIIASFGNDLQFSKGNLFCRNSLYQAVLQALFIEQDGSLMLLTANALDGLQAGSEMDRLLAEKGLLDGLLEENTSDEPPTENDSNEKKDIDEIASLAASFPQRTETIALSMDGYNDAIDVSAVSKISGMKAKVVKCPLWIEAMLTELMTGNPAVDIYVFGTASTISVNCRRLGLYVPLNESEIIRQYLDGCFEYVGEAATAENGDIWMVPLYAYPTVTWYVPENMELFGIKEENLDTVGHYLDTLGKLSGTLGDYRYYNYSSRFISYCDTQYDFNYNDYENLQIDFNTELYRNLIEQLWTGWLRSEVEDHPLFYSIYRDYSKSYVPTDSSDFDRSRVIFKTTSVQDHLEAKDNKLAASWSKALEGWRVMDAPKLQDTSERQGVNVTYAMVNPYSEQKEAAIAYLEAIVSSPLNTVMQPVFFQKDIAAYASQYDITQPAFLDLYNIYQNLGVEYGYSFDQYDTYIDEYQEGKITVDQAIERRQKSAETGLYE